ncbi:MAG TPA: DNA polymerase III subunit delta, partial [Candidatus Paceibacterota bacterium]|nr:DNA polymerase III subunit delta [Candidatus Paceibacterota bacterium]
EALQGLSFFDEIKLVVLKNPLTGDKDALLSVLQKSGVTKDAKVTVLACQSGKFDQRKPPPLLKFLADKENLVRNFELLSGTQLSSWLRHQAVARGTPFTAGALKLFMEIGGGDSWERANNLDKLANFCRGPITEKAVLALVGQPGSSNLFELIDAIGTRNRPQAYERLWRELAAGSDPYSILSMIAYQFRTMLTVKDLAQRGLSGSSLAQKAALHPFVARKMSSFVSKLELNDLIRRFQSVQKLEIAAKSGRIDLVDGLFVLALS